MSYNSCEINRKGRSIRPSTEQHGMLSSELSPHKALYYIIVHLTRGDVVPHGPQAAWHSLINNNSTFKTYFCNKEHENKDVDLNYPSPTHWWSLPTFTHTHTHTHTRAHARTTIYIGYRKFKNLKTMTPF